MLGSPNAGKSRPGLRAYSAKLAIAKLDCFSRDAHFLLGLEKASTSWLSACQMPTAHGWHHGDGGRRRTANDQQAHQRRARRRQASWHKAWRRSWRSPKHEARAMGVEALRARADAKAKPYAERYEYRGYAAYLRSLAAHFLPWTRRPERWQQLAYFGMGGKQVWGRGARQGITQRTRRWLKPFSHNRGDPSFKGGPSPGQVQAWPNRDGPRSLRRHELSHSLGNARCANLCDRDAR